MIIKNEENYEEFKDLCGRYISLLPNPNDKIKIEFKDYYTIVTFEDGDIIKVACSEKDKFNPEFGFLMAYFQKYSKLNKTQTRKFMESINKNYIRNCY